MKTKANNKKIDYLLLDIVRDIFKLLGINPPELPEVSMSDTDELSDISEQLFDGLLTSQSYNQLSVVKKQRLALLIEELEMSA